MSAPEFSVEIFQNEYLAGEAREVSAVVSVTSEGLPVHAATATGAAEIIIVDTSGSMSAPQAKMIEAREATAAAIDAIRDGVAFAVIAGSHYARSLYPAKESMAIASPQTRADAKRTLRFLRPEGGTAMGSWLRLAHQIFTTRDEQLRHAILLTDGMNQSQSVSALDSALELCTGVFSCDCRGVGTDWKVEELRRISTALLGTVDIIPDASGLAADFEAMMAASMSSLQRLARRCWPRESAWFKPLTPVRSRWARGSSRRSGPMMKNCRPRSIGMWPAIRLRLNSRRRSRTDWRRARRATWKPPRHCSGAQSIWLVSLATN